MSQNVAESIPDHSFIVGGTASVSDFVKTRAVAKGVSVTEPVTDIVNHTLRHLCTLVLFATQMILFPKTFHTKRGPPQAECEHRVEQSKAKTKT